MLIWLWLIPAAWTVALLVVYARRRPPATYAPMPSVTDTATGMADRSRSERLTGGFAHDFYCTHDPCRCDPDWTTDDGPDAA